MAIWPFGRRSKKKTDSDNKIARASASKYPQGTAADPISEMSDVNSSTAGGKPRRKPSHRRSSRKLTKAPHSNPKDPEKAEIIQAMLEPSQPTAKRRVTKVESTDTDRPLVPSNGMGDSPSYYFQNTTSLTSLQPETFSVFPLPPTLRAKKPTNDAPFPRRKSSKRKAEDQAREKEIKAMSSPIPIPKRPNSRIGGNHFRDGKKGFHSFARNPDRPLSDVSLPIPESIHSTVSVVSDSHGFRISALDALAPRPTIRYLENPRHKEFGSGSFGPARSSTKRERKAFTPEDGLKPNQRIAYLADELDAGSLRELMDRDQRRSERSRRSEQEKLQRKLQKKADSQQAAETAEEGGEYGSATENVNPITKGNKDMGPEDATSLPAVGFSKTPFGDLERTTSVPWTKDLAKENVKLGMITPAERSDPILETAKVVRLSQASVSPPLSPKHANQGPGQSLPADVGSRSPFDFQEYEMRARDSDASGRLSNNWTSIFRRSGIRAKESFTDRGQLSPSEFSNTSRESFTRQTPPSAFARIPPARSGTPVRTHSRFREDLPEHPHAPPDSGLPSSQASEQPDLRNRDMTGPFGESPVISDLQLSEIHPAFRDQVLQNRQQPTNYSSPEIPSSAILSQSLASVDSEGSWLTGRPMKRISPTFATPLRGSASSLPRSRDFGAASDNEAGNSGDEQDERRRINPDSGEAGDARRKRSRGRGGAMMGIGSDSDDDDIAFEPEPPTMPHDEGTWHSAVGKHPTIVRQGPLAKSREGLLDDFQAAAAATVGEDSVGSSSPPASAGDSPMAQPFDDQITPPENSLIYRATSVDLGKGHARHMSAGSARLLDLPPRSSGELKRFSTASGGERSPLSVSTFGAVSSSATPADGERGGM